MGSCVRRLLEGVVQASRAIDQDQEGTDELSPDPNPNPNPTPNPNANPNPNPIALPEGRQVLGVGEGLGVEGRQRRARIGHEVTVAVVGRGRPFAVLDPAAVSAALETGDYSSL